MNLAINNWKSRVHVLPSPGHNQPHPVKNRPVAESHPINSPHHNNPVITHQDYNRPVAVPMNPHYPQNQPPVHDYPTTHNIIRNNPQPIGDSHARGGIQTNSPGYIPEYQGPYSHAPANDGPYSHAPANQGPYSHAPANQGPYSHAPANQGPYSHAPAHPGPYNHYNNKSSGVAGCMNQNNR